jgi:hypothetical protein
VRSQLRRASRCVTRYDLDALGVLLTVSIAVNAVIIPPAAAGHEPDARCPAARCVFSGEVRGILGQLYQRATSLQLVCSSAPELSPR